MSAHTLASTQELKEEASSALGERDASFWREVNLLEKELPGDIWDAANKVHIETKQLDVLGISLFVRDAHPPTGVVPVETPSLLLLHGMAFKSETWVNLNTMHIFAGLGYRVVAVDLPGYGNTKEEFKGDRAEFMTSLLPALDLIKPVIVSPSMSGSYALPFLAKHPNMFGGYVPIAPVMTESLSASTLASIQVPVVIIYGSKDNHLGHTSRDNLKVIRSSQVLEIPNAGHPAYLDDPVKFHTILFNFLSLLQR